MCGQRLFLMSACERHLEVKHKFCMKAFDDTLTVLTERFDFAAIDKLEELINSRANLKPILSPIVGSSPEDCKEFFYQSDEEVDRSFDQSFQYMSSVKRRKSDQRPRNYQTLTEMLMASPPLSKYFLTRKPFPNAIILPKTRPQEASHRCQVQPQPDRCQNFVLKRFSTTVKKYRNSRSI
jgi:hypothetical protein